MSSLAVVFLAQGFSVSGSDIKESANTKALRASGATVMIGHKPENVSGASVVVASSAIRPDNTELAAAGEAGITVIQRAQLLAYLMDTKRGIAVAGTHGKTTTTSMISQVLDGAGLDPTFLIGGELNDIGSGARSGGGEFLVAEADESDGSLLCYRPEIAVITNVEADHLDYYPSIVEIKDVFKRFLAVVPEHGYAVICLDDKVASELAGDAPCKCHTYGFDEAADFAARDVHLGVGETTFTAVRAGRELGRVTIKVPGRHNVENTLATLAVGMLIGLPFKRVAKGLRAFGGVRRRFQYKGEAASVTIVDDYAHHPSEVAATLEAATTGDWSRVVSVFQPHRYSRTNHLHAEFGASFTHADLVVVTDVYAAGEDAIPGVDGKLVVDSILEADPKKQVAYLPKKTDVAHYLLSVLGRGDLLLTLGAGDVWSVGEEVLHELESGRDQDTA